MHTYVRVTRRRDTLHALSLGNELATDPGLVRIDVLVADLDGNLLLAGRSVDIDGVAETYGTELTLNIAVNFGR